MPKCIASSSDLDRVELSLHVTGLAPHFDPSRCLVVEDSPHEVTAAIAAGMPVLGFVGGQHARPSLTRRLVDAGATTIINNAQDIALHL